MEREGVGGGAGAEETGGEVAGELGGGDLWGRRRHYLMEPLKG